VILNLVTNAAEAIEGGNGIVSVRTSLVNAKREDLISSYLEGKNLPEGEYVSLEVSDNGRGMTAETIANLFDPFYTTKFTGRGLGLAVVQGVIRRHHGTIRVQSELGRGSTIRVMFPKSFASVQPASPPALAAQVRGAGKILVIDDEPMVRQVIILLLQNAGFEVIEAESGAKAIELFRSQPTEFRAILLDLTMPGQSGHEVAIELHRLCNEIPILLMSGYDAEHTSSNTAPGLIRGFLCKPFTPSALLQAIFAALGEAAPSEARLDN
jgi:CheY-like chemotaxis protein